MQANSAEHQPLDNSTAIIGISPSAGHSDDEADHLSRYSNEPTYFHGHYESAMEMFADAQTVADYLDRHREWFHRCAHPMTAEPLGENGYALTIGKFGSFGYEVEPKIGLDLLPQDRGVYRIRTIPVPGYESQGYEVDFQASLQLVEIETDFSLYQGAGKSLPPRMTQVEWELQLEVAIQFPRFIHSLPKPIIQTTGDRLLNQIVRQASRCLTHKVQEDFHSIRDIPMPRRRKRFPWQRDAQSAHEELPND